MAACHIMALSIVRILTIIRRWNLIAMALENLDCSYVFQVQNIDCATMMNWLVNRSLVMSQIGSMI